MRILGLDVGTTSIKAIELDTAFGRFEVHEYHEIPIAEGSVAMHVAAQFVHGLPKQPDKIVTTMRSKGVTHRNLRLPTRDKKAIQSSVGFELEDDLPFETDESVHDYTNLGADGAETVVFVGAALRKTVEDYLSLMMDSGLDPDILTTEACSYRALLRKIAPTPQHDEQPILLANIGHNHTTLYVQYRGMPVVCREVPWGGKDINLALSKRYALSVDQGEKTKVDNGFVLPLSQMPQVTEEQKEFAGTVYDALQGLIRDMKQADLACKNITQMRLGLVYLTGGTSLLPGLPAVIAEDVKIPTQQLRALSSLGGSGVTYSEQTDAKFALALGSALSLVGSERSFTLNFRKGAFARSHKKGADVDFSAYGKPVGILVTASLLVLAMLAVESNLYTVRLEDANKQLEKSVQGFFNNLPKSTLKSYLANTNTLRKNVEAELNKERELVKLLSPNPYSPFDTLKDLSNLIPRDLVTDMMAYQVGSSPTQPYLGAAGGEHKVELTFTVANVALGEKLTALLSSKLKDVQQSAPEPTTAHDGTKRWKLTYTAKMPEGSANGK